MYLLTETALGIPLRPRSVGTRLDPTDAHVPARCRVLLRLHIARKGGAGHAAVGSEVTACLSSQVATKEDLGRSLHFITRALQALITRYLRLYPRTAYGFAPRQALTA
jgi:hypothetical protein